MNCANKLHLLEKQQRLSTAAVRARRGGRRSGAARRGGPGRRQNTAAADLPFAPNADDMKQLHLRLVTDGLEAGLWERIRDKLHLSYSTLHT